MHVATSLPAKESAVRAVVTRADGRIEDLGLIAYWNRNPLIHYPVNAYIHIRDFINGRSRPK